MKHIFLIYLLGHIFAHVASDILKNECPEPADIFPCYCEEEDGDAEVTCNHLSKPEDIYKGVKGLKGHKIYKISFFMNWILEPIKSDAFKDVPAERIAFENSTVMLTAPQFEGMDYLNSIQLMAIYNNTNPLVPLDVGHLQSLREINYAHNRMLTLPNNWLKTSPESLRSVWLEANSIITLEDEVFTKINKLTFLILESNRIISMKRSMFSRPATYLRSINLSYNKIRYLPSDMFSEMPNLSSLELTGNRLTTLDEPVWRIVIERITRLDVSDNPLECDSTLKWLYTDVKMPALFTGQCQSPEKLSGISLSKLKVSDLS